MRAYRRNAEHAHGSTARWARIKHARGWSVQQLANRYGVSEGEILRVLEFRKLPRSTLNSPCPSRALPAAEKQRRKDERARLHEEALARRIAERLALCWEPDDSRHPDGIQADGTALTLPPAPAAAELLDQAVAEIPPAELEPPAPEPWEGYVSPHATRARPWKITPEVLAEALCLRESGWSWPRIARKFGCHRMAFYHAIRRNR